MKLEKSLLVSGERIYNNFKLDSIVYSIFNNRSYQSSLRNVIYRGNTYNIKNEFFWMSKNEMVEISNQNNYNDTSLRFAWRN